MPPDFIRLLLAGIVTTTVLTACMSSSNGSFPSQTEPVMHGADDVDLHPTWKNCESRCVVNGHPQCCEAGD